MRVLFVNPAMERYTRQVSFPLGMMSIATYLQANGHTVKIIDRTIKTTNIKKEIEKFSPDVVGVAVYSLKSFADAQKVTLEAKKYGAKTVWGGIFVSLDPEFVFNNIDIDYISIGEGEATWLELVQSLELGKDISAVAGLAFKKDGKVIYTPEREFIDLAILPPIDFTLIDVDKYLGAMYGCKKTALLYMSKGCYGQCTFCFNSEFHRRCHRERPLETFFSEVKYLMENHGVDCIYFADELFGKNKADLKYLCEAFIDSKLGFKWVAQTRAGYFDIEDYQLMKDAGCVAIDFGIETGSPSMLDKIKKNISYERIRETFEFCNEVGLVSLANFIIGFPDETEEQFRETINMAMDIPSTQRTFFFFMPGPGSELYSQLVSDGRYHPPKTFKEYTNIKFFYSPDPNFSKVSSKDLKVVRAYFLWKGFSRKYFSETSRTYDIAKKDIVDVLKQFKGHNLKFAVQLILISAYEFSDIFFYAHFFPSVIKKYNLKID
ncbi:MAG: radical SAM protein [Ruminococcaceae bacterium]|nr:radical SAM protein [Oscillospiraceae bacterium]